jgi:hypothetical protein
LRIIPDKGQDEGIVLGLKVKQTYNYIDQLSKAISN